MRFSIVAPLFGLALLCDCADIDTLHAATKSLLLPGLASSDADVLQHIDSEIPYLLQTLNSSGLFPDVQYNDGADRSEWLTAIHLQRCLMLAVAYASNSSTWSGNATVASASLICTSSWVGHDFQNTNWWWMQFGVPHLVAKSLFLVPNANTLQAANAIIFPRNSLNYTTGWLGANRVWSCTINILIGLVNSNSTHIDASYALLHDGLAITTDDGIQADLSFHQHGPLAYFSYGYGAHFASNALTAEAVATGTRWSTNGTSPVWNNLAGYITQGARWVSTGGIWHTGAMGRHESYYKSLDSFGVSDGHYHTYAAYTAFSLAFPSYVAPMDSPLTVLYAPLLPLFSNRSVGGSDMKAFYEQVMAGDGSGGVSGHRRFWRTDYSVHSMPSRSISFSLHTYGNRTLNSECVNSENLLGRTLADGLLMSCSSGREYEGIYPVWRWSLLPGTTEVQLSGAGVYTCENTQITAAADRQPFVGGASDDWLGVACMDLARSDEGGHAFGARKSWFFFEDGVVALGAGIQSDGDINLTTGIEQRLLDASSPVLYQTSSSATPNTLTPGSPAVNSTDLQWMWHSNRLYIQMQKPSDSGIGAYASIHANNQSGSWADIVDAPGDSAAVSLPVLLHYVHHGPVTQAQPTTYAYAILGGVAQSDAATANTGFTANTMIVSNTPLVQSVCQSSVNASVAWMMQSVFWPAAASLSPDDGNSVAATAAGAAAGCANVTSSMPLLAMVSFWPSSSSSASSAASTGSIVVTVSDPMIEAGHTNATVTITGLDVPLESRLWAGVAAEAGSSGACAAGLQPGSVVVSLPLPTGAVAGSSVTVTCSLA